jgi:hypothetical protein
MHHFRFHDYTLLFEGVEKNLKACNSGTEKKSKDILRLHSEGRHS